MQPGHAWGHDGVFLALPDLHLSFKAKLRQIDGGAGKCNESSSAKSCRLRKKIPHFFIGPGGIRDRDSQSFVIVAAIAAVVGFIGLRIMSTMNDLADKIYEKQLALVSLRQGGAV
jgi:hypothetical protein